MKKNLFILALLILALCITSVTAEGSLADATSALRGTKTINELLAMHNEIAVKYSSNLESGAWDISLNTSLPEALPEAYYPPVSLADAVSGGLPEEMLGKKYIVLYRKDNYDGSGKYNTLLGDYLDRLPSANRAESLEETEAVLLLRESFSYNTNYTGSAYNRLYDYYIWEVGGSTVWLVAHKMTTPPHSGYGTLHGEEIPLNNNWYTVRDIFYGKTFDLTDEYGNVMTFEITGESSCSLKSVTFAEGAMTLIIPQPANDLTVTEIGRRCMADNEIIESVVIPQGVTQISEKAFESCPNLVCVDLPDTLEVLGEAAFSSCRKLRDIEFPDSLIVIENAVFYCCDALESLRIPASLKTVDGYPYQFIDKVARVVICEGVRKVYFPISRNLRCCYLPSTLSELPHQFSYSDKQIVFYAPADSYAMSALIEKGYTCVACDNPEDMPYPEYITEGDFEFLILEGDVWLNNSFSKEENLIVPETAAGRPVKQIRYRSLHAHQCVVIPATVDYIDSDVFSTGYRNSDYYPIINHLYIRNPDVEINSFAQSHSTIIHAPEGGLVQQYAENNGNPFEAWDGETMPF